MKFPSFSWPMAMNTAPEHSPNTLVLPVVEPELSPQTKPPRRPSHCG
jgi:hypothetical protein